MTTEKDQPKSRGIPASQNDAAMKEAFHDRIDTDNAGEFTGIAKQTAEANRKRAEAILKSVKPKR